MGRHEYRLFFNTFHVVNLVFDCIIPFINKNPKNIFSLKNFVSIYTAWY